MIPEPLTPEMRSNFRRLYADIAWFGVLSGSTASFLAIYAARLEASSLQLGFLTAGPAVVNLLISLPAGRWLETRPLVRSVFQSSVAQRLGYLAVVPLPWLFKAADQVWAVLLITLLMAVPATLVTIGFNAMFAGLVPPGWRARVVGRRNALLAISMTITSLLCGQILDRIDFPLNYQLVFALGAAGALMSSYHLGWLRSTEQQALRSQPIGDLARPGVLARLGGPFRFQAGMRFLARPAGKRLLRLDLLRGPSGPFLAAYLVFYIFQYLPLPLFPLFYVNELRLSDSAISLGTALFQATVTVASLSMVSASTRFGHKRILVAGALLFGQYPLLLAFARNATLFWVASFTGGLVWALLSAGLVNRLMERVPEGDRPAYMALHNLALNLGILLGSLSGPLLMQWMGLQEAILASFVLRLLAGLLLYVWV